MADNENTILTEEESTRIINLSEAAEMDAGMYFVTDSSNGTRKVPITKLIDANLEDEYAAAPAKEVGDLKEELEHISGISDDVKDALLQIASKVAYIDDDGQDYYDALELALYPPAELDSISAVYTQSGTVYDTDSLDSLKSDLVVTAHYSDQTTETVTSYTLSGTLSVGTSTITVSYGGKTTTFTVVVSEPTYVTDGLIMWLDGEKNGQNGEHNDSVTKWYDQTGNEWDWTASNAFTAGSNYIEFSGDRLQRADIPQNVAMVEIVIAFPTNSSSSSYTAILTGFTDAYPGNVTTHANNIEFHTGTSTGSANNKKLTRIADTNPHSYNSAGYIDGATSSTFTSGGDSWQYDRPAIGNYRSHDDRGEYPFSGKIYCIRLYSRILTEAEVLENYNVDSVRFGI